MSDTKLSKGAMRAAEEAVDLVIAKLFYNQHLIDNDAFARRLKTDCAPLIDRETHAGEMAALLRESTGWIHDHGHDWDYFPDWVKRAERLLKEIES